MSGWSSKEVAAAWVARAEERKRWMLPITDRLLDAAGVAAGMRVLDVGTGAGDAALRAAERVGTGGAVVAIDASEEMLEQAREAVARAGAAASQVRVLAAMDAAALADGAGVGAERAAGNALANASFDAVIAQHVLMFVDVARTLRGVRRVLRAGGRFGATVWGGLVGSPYHRVIIEAARARGGWGEPTPEVVLAFAREDAGAWREAMVAAAFEDVRVETAVAERRFASAEAAFESARASPLHREPIERLVGAEEREAAWREVEAGYRAFGGVFPMEFRLVSGAAPRA